MKKENWSGFEKLLNQTLDKVSQTESKPYCPKCKKNSEMPGHWCKVCITKSLKK